MSTDPYLNAEEEAAFRAMRNVGLFFRLDLLVSTDDDQTLRLWGGMGNFPVKEGTSDTPFTGMESLDSAGDIYYGLGEITDLPELEALVNGLADRADFVLSGVHPNIAHRIDSSAPSVKGREVHVGMAPLNALWQPVIPIKPLWMGLADYWAVQRTPYSSPEDPGVTSLILSVGGGTTGRSRPKRTSFTHAQQIIDYPDDLYFEYEAKYHQHYVVSWPRF